MSPYRTQEVDTETSTAIATIHWMNRMSPDIFPELESRHLENGYWWLAYLDGEVAAFAGLVPFEPFVNVGYLKRAYVMPDHRGHGLQLRMLVTRELKARELGWTQLVSECASGSHSARNFCRARYARIEPEQPWGAPQSIYWAKALT